MRPAAGAGAIPGQNESSAQAADPAVEESESGKRLGVPELKGGQRGGEGAVWHKMRLEPGWGVWVLS